MSASMLSPRQLFFNGVRASIPNLTGVMPFGLITGAFSVSVFNSVAASVTLTALLFAGRSQVVSLQLLKDGAPWVIVFLAGLVVNLRHLMYGASLAPHFRHLSGRWKVLLAALLVDNAYAVGAPYLREHREDELAATRHYYYLGSGVANWIVWSGCGLIGALLGARIPASWSLDFVPQLSFIAIIMANIRDRSYVVAAIAAGATAVSLAFLPWASGLFIGGMVGIVAGQLIGQRGRH